MARLSGWVSIQAGDQWNGSQLQQGIKIPLDSESLDIGEERKSPSIVNGGRSVAYSNWKTPNPQPQGGFKWGFRSQELPVLLMSHFQNCVGTDYGSDTWGYKFTSSKSSPTLGGTGFSEGTYGASGSLFPVQITKAFYDDDNGHGTAIKFYNGVCDSIEFDLEAGEQPSLSANFQFQSAGTSQFNGREGRYSSLRPFDPDTHSLSLSFQIGSYLVEAVRVKFKSENSIERKNGVGTSKATGFRFGKYRVSGDIELDDSNKYDTRALGSFLANYPFSISGTLSNGTNDRVYFDMPLCRPKKVDIGYARTISIPFEAFESDDGGTAPLTIRVDTHDMGTNKWQPKWSYWGDAVFGTRSTPLATNYDAGTGARDASYRSIIRGL